MLSVPGGDHEGSLDELSHMLLLDEILRGKQPPFGHCSSILILEKRLKSLRAEHKEVLVDI